MRFFFSHPACHTNSQMQVKIGSVHQAEGEKSDKHLADGSDGKGLPSLSTEFTETGAQTYPGKG